MCQFYINQTSFNKTTHSETMYNMPFHIYVKLSSNYTPQTKLYLLPLSPVAGSDGLTDHNNTSGRFHVTPALCWQLREPHLEY